MGERRGFPAPAHQQVDLHVHQTRQQDLLTEVDEVTLVGGADKTSLSRTPDADDPVVLDPQDAWPDDLAHVDVKKPGGLERQHCVRSPAP